MLLFLEVIMVEVWPILCPHAQHVEIGSEQCRNFHTEILRPESLDDADVHRLCGAAYLALTLSGRLAGTCALRLHHRWLRKLLTDRNHEAQPFFGTPGETPDSNCPWPLRL